MRLQPEPKLAQESSPCQSGRRDWPKWPPGYQCHAQQWMANHLPPTVGAAAAAADAAAAAAAARHPDFAATGLPTWDLSPQPKQRGYGYRLGKLQGGKASQGTWAEGPPPCGGARYWRHTGASWEWAFGPSPHGSAWVWRYTNSSCCRAGHVAYQSHATSTLQHGGASWRHTVRRRA